MPGILPRSYLLPRPGQPANCVPYSPYHTGMCTDTRQQQRTCCSSPRRGAGAEARVPCRLVAILGASAAPGILGDERVVAAAVQGHGTAWQQRRVALLHHQKEGGGQRDKSYLLLVAEVSCGSCHSSLQVTWRHPGP